MVLLLDHTVGTLALVSEVRPYFDGLVGLGSGLVGVGGCGFGASTRRAASCAVQDQLSS